MIGSSDLIARYGESVKRKLMCERVDILDIDMAQAALSGCVMAKKLQQTHLAMVSIFETSKQMGLFNQQLTGHDPHI